LGFGLTARLEITARQTLKPTALSVVNAPDTRDANDGPDLEPQPLRDAADRLPDAGARRVDFAPFHAMERFEVGLFFSRFRLDY
jgi:hypothetical protein